MFFSILLYVIGDMIIYMGKASLIFLLLGVVTYFYKLDAIRGDMTVELEGRRAQRS